VVSALPLVYLPQELYPFFRLDALLETPDTLRLYNSLLMIVYAPVRR
jgi:hypothetical protein